MEVKRGDSSKAFQNVLKQKEILTNLISTANKKNNNFNEVKLKQKLLAVVLLLRRWSIKYKEENTLMLYVANPILKNCLHTKIPCSQ